MSEYKNVEVCWNDNPDVWFSTKVAVGIEWDGETDDNDVFFYFTDHQDYETYKVFDPKYEFTLREEQ